MANNILEDEDADVGSWGAVTGDKSAATLIFPRDIGRPFSPE